MQKCSNVSDKISMLVFNATQVLEAMDDDEPPLVIEYNGINHYSAYRREGVPEHDGYNQIVGLKRFTKGKAKTNSSSASGPSTSTPSEPQLASPSASTRARKRKHA